MAFFKSLLKVAGLPYDDASYILSQITIAHMIEGRIRVIYKALCKDDELYNTVKARLSELKEVDNFSINRITGSVIIEYSPKHIIKDSFLDKLLSGAKLKYAQERAKWWWEHRCRQVFY